MDPVVVNRWQSEVREAIARIRALQQSRRGEFSWVDVAKQIEVITARVNAGNQRVLERKRDLVHYDVLREEAIILMAVVGRAQNWVKDEVALKRLVQVEDFLQSVLQAIDGHQILFETQLQGKEVDESQLVRLETLLFRQFEPYKEQLLQELQHAASLPPGDDAAQQLALAAAIRGWTIS